MEYDVNKIKIDLTQKDFIAKGGEGSIFGKGKMAYKIYEDPSKMIAMQKIQELAVLTDPNIIKPDSLVYQKNKVVGYSMRLVEGAVLCQLFTKAYKQRNNISHDQILKLIEKFYDIVSHIHSHNILLVDLNELNFLVDNLYKEIYAIDVNSYQTPSYPATVIMPSVRDRHCNNHFTKETDWFSWGIVAFQMLIGIHPYKGNHPDFEKMGLDERLDSRMKKNVSVLHQNVRIPKVCEPFDSIPTGLRNWFKAVFEDGKRIVPPRDFAGGVIHLAPIVKQLMGDLFDIMELEKFEEEIVSYFAYGGNRIAQFKNHVLHGKNRYAIPTATNGVFTFTQKQQQPLFIYKETGSLKIFDIAHQQFLPFTANADDVMRCEDRIYYKNNNSVYQLSFGEIGGQIHCMSKTVGNVLDLPSATKVFDGGIIQNLLGRYYVSIFPQSGKCYQIPIAELDNYQIVQAKYENKILVVIGVTTNGKYDRMLFKLDENFNSYSFAKKEDITHTGINFTVTDAGTVILINEDEDVEAFVNNSKSTSSKLIKDNNISSDMKLYHDGTVVLFTQHDKLYKISMKK